MDFEEEFQLEHLLFKDRRCRSCNKVKDLLTDFYRTRKGRSTLSAYSYECKDCTVKRVVETRKKKARFTEEGYPDW